MQSALKRKIASLAILLIALQALFPDMVALSASATTIDQAVICHTGDLNQPARQPSSTDDCCAHCVLCNGLAAAPPPSPAATHIAWLPGEVLTGQSSTELATAQRSSDNFARGPPLFA